MRVFGLSFEEGKQLTKEAQVPGNRGTEVKLCNAFMFCCKAGLSKNQLTLLVPF